MPISFSISLAEALGGSQVHWVHREETTAQCPGNVENPQATPGNLCVYEFFVLGGTSIEPPHILEPGASAVSGSGKAGAGTAGAVISFGESEGALGWGSWALTGPDAE
jgi:hypothetical protein